MMLPSIWEKIPLPLFDTLRGDQHADIAVIGAGMAGLLTAYLLQKSGAQVIVLERSQVGHGITAGTTAKVTAQHGLIYDRLRHTVGMERTRQYAQANLDAVEQYADLINRLGIDCDFSRAASIVYTLRDPKALTTECVAAASAGISMALTRQTELPFEVNGALLLDNQAYLHPLKFLSAISRGLMIYQNSPALEIDGHWIITKDGRVHAGQIVLATHYPIVKLPGLFFLRLYQERAAALAMENAPILRAMYLNEDPSGISLRSHGETLILAGAEARVGRTGPQGQFPALEQAAHTLYPEGNIVARWIAQDCMSLEHIPYIGRLSRGHDHIYVATGMGKWGMTGSMVAAQLLHEMLQGRTHPYADVFSPQRLHMAASAKRFFSHAGHMISGMLSAGTIIRKPYTSLERGEGGVFLIRGKKYGIYRDTDGMLWLVSLRCPHLGCLLRWNPDAATWDCPCHGSRFDYRGQPIESPAVGTLTSHLLDE